MRLAALLLANGLALTFLGLILAFASGGGPCRVESCGPRINEIAFYAGLTVIAIAVLRVIWVVARSVIAKRRAR